MKRLPILAAAALLSLGARAYTIDTSAASPLTGLWWNPTESGWGATLTQQSNRLFVTMFAYDAAGNPTWYTMSCEIVTPRCEGDLVRVRGGGDAALPWAGSGLTIATAGRMTLDFTSNDRAAMRYTLDGRAAARDIQRQHFGPPVPAPASLHGTWFGGIVENRSQCAQAQNNGARATFGQYDISLSGSSEGAFTMTLAGVTGLTCTWSGTFATDGARQSAAGNFTCNDGRRGDWQTTRTSVTARNMSIEMNTVLTGSETCRIDGVLGGSRL